VNLPLTTLLARIGLAFGLGFLLGLEREVKGHEAGLRTHILVCLGACLFTLAGAYGMPLEALTQFSGAARVDVARVASQVVVGIGFLGGGAILRQGNTVRGLTTAAGLWIAAAIGLSCALGFFAPALIVTGFALFALLFFKPLEAWAARAGKRARHGNPPEGSDI
jgi:putative Mg2+ transporter-C (MgtC) family protein